MPLPSEKLRERIENIIEQPPFHPGGGGLASTDKDSYAEARALLVLAALQAYPVMVRRFPNLRIKQLFEAHPGDGITGVADEKAVKVFFLELPLPPPVAWREHLSPQSRVQLLSGGGAQDSSPEPPPSTASAEIHCRVDIPVRSSRTGKCMEPGAVRKNLLRALLMAEAGVRGYGSEGELASATAALEDEYRAKYYDNAPKDLVHLFWMHIVSNSTTLVEEFDKYFTDAGKARAVARGIKQQEFEEFPGIVRTETRGSAVGLWWPVPSTAITYLEMQKERSELKEALNAVKQAEAGESRELRLRAALQRQNKSPTLNK